MIEALVNDPVLLESLTYVDEMGGIMESIFTISYLASFIPALVGFALFISILPEEDDKVGLNVIGIGLVFLFIGVGVTVYLFTFPLITYTETSYTVEQADLENAELSEFGLYDVHVSGNYSEFDSVTITTLDGEFVSNQEIFVKGETKVEVDLYKGWETGDTLGAEEGFRIVLLDEDKNIVEEDNVMITKEERELRPPWFEG